MKPQPAEVIGLAAMLFDCARLGATIPSCIAADTRADSRGMLKPCMLARRLGWGLVLGRSPRLLRTKRCSRLLAATLRLFCGIVSWYHAAPPHAGWYAAATSLTLASGVVGIHGAFVSARANTPPIAAIIWHTAHTKFTVDRSLARADRPRRRHEWWAAPLGISVNACMLLATSTEPSRARDV